MQMYENFPGVTGLKYNRNCYIWKNGDKLPTLNFLMEVEPDADKKKIINFLNQPIHHLYESYTDYNTHVLVSFKIPGKYHEIVANVLLNRQPIFNNTQLEQLKNQNQKLENILYQTLIQSMKGVTNFVSRISGRYGSNVGFTEKEFNSYVTREELVHGEYIEMPRKSIYIDSMIDEETFELNTETLKNLYEFLEGYSDEPKIFNNDLDSIQIQP
jgi:hypothetical protein